MQLFSDLIQSGFWFFTAPVGLLLIPDQVLAESRHDQMFLWKRPAPLLEPEEAEERFQSPVPSDLNVLFRFCFKTSSTVFDYL